MSGQGSILLGYSKFRSAIENGTDDPQMSQLVAYAQYLSNGGTPDGWKQMTPTDILLMQTYYNDQKYRELEGQALLIAKYIGKLFGGEK